MILLILAVLLLYLVQIYIAAGLYNRQITVAQNVGPRDLMPPKGRLAARADRALANLKENLPLFFVPAFLVLLVDDAAMGLAIAGAAVFLAARIAYVPLYIGGVAYVRSLAYLAGLIGCLLIVLALLV